MSAKKKRGWWALLLLVAGLVLAFQLLEFFANRVLVDPLPEGTTPADVESMVQQVLDSRSTSSTSGAVADLSTRLEEVWTSLDDKQGGQLFFDSKFTDRQVQITETARETHLALLPALKDAAVTLGCDVLPSPPPGKNTGKGQVSISEARIEFLCLALAQAYRRIASKLSDQQDFVAALEYVETALRLLRVPNERVTLANLPTTITELEYLSQFSYVALDLYDEPTLRNQMTTLLDQQLQFHSGFSPALEAEIARVWLTAEKAPLPLLSWQRKQQYHGTLRHVLFLEGLRKLAKTAPENESELESRLEALGSLVPDPALRKPYLDHWKNYQRSMKGFATNLEKLRELEWKER